MKGIKGGKSGKLSILFSLVFLFLGVGKGKLSILIFDFVFCYSNVIF
jgi:hypothetical protein